MNINKLKGGIFGVTIGDALGVPVEFKSREFLRVNPVKDFLGYLCWNQPPGTWSDDSSLTLCLIDSLINGFDIEDIGQKFANWYQNGYWGAHHKVFDVGGSIRCSLERIIAGESARFSGGFFEYDNGNGSLMRILPMVYFLQNERSIEERFMKIREVSSITHANLRSVLSCFIYTEYALLLLKGDDKYLAYQKIKKQLVDFVEEKDFNQREIKLFERVLIQDIFDINESEIKSSGYVLHSLEASLWCFLNTDSYQEAVLKAVNLGDDTDTTAAITGGLAGLYYGYDKIPENWKKEVARFNDIESLIENFYTKLENEIYC
ncbi:ADP-ribosylglycohydrolase family protein [Flavobacteriaceae bacterium R38]|nr:ADP-ribosylglycohydrolase family protein [Flavobacteriaceae bacterium R38]